MEKERLYYSISEVAEMFDVNQSLLRYWEKEFSEHLQLRKNPKGTRSYTKENIETLKLIYFLVKTQGLTLAGANKKLKSSKSDIAKNQEIYDRLSKIKTELLSIKKSITHADEIDETDLYSDEQENSL